MLREIIESAVAGQPDMQIVGSVNTRDLVVDAIDENPADVIIVCLRLSEKPATLDFVLRANPSVKLLAISGDGATAYLYELRPYSVPLGGLSPGGLVDAIRATAVTGAR